MVERNSRLSIHQALIAKSAKASQETDNIPAEEACTSDLQVNNSEIKQSRIKLEVVVNMMWGSAD